MIMTKEKTILSGKRLAIVERWHVNVEFRGLLSSLATPKMRKTLKSVPVIDSAT